MPQRSQKNLLGKEKPPALRVQISVTSGNRFFKDPNTEWKSEILLLGFSSSYDDFKYTNWVQLGEILTNLIKFTIFWNFQGFWKTKATSFPGIFLNSIDKILRSLCEHVICSKIHVEIICAQVIFNLCETERFFGSAQRLSRWRVEIGDTPYSLKWIQENQASALRLPCEVWEIGWL